MKKHVVMIIANSPNPSYFNWFAELNYKEKACKISYVFLHTENPPLTEKVKYLGVTSYWIYFNTFKSKPLQYLKVLIKLYSLFKKIKPDVVQTNLFDDTLPAMLAAKLAGVKKRVITKQDTGYHVNYNPSIVKFDKFNNRNATDLIAVSGESKEFIIKHENGDLNKLHLIHHGVDEAFITTTNEKDIEYLKSRFKLQNKIVIGTVSRYIELKGYIDLINAVEILVPKYPNLIFLGVGYGEVLKVELEKIITEKNLQDHFILTDLIDYNLIPAVYSCLDVYVHAAKIEAFGFVLAEAMFNKKPIITTKVGAARDVLEHKKSAYLINYNSPSEIVEGVDYMLSNDVTKMTEEAYSLAKQNFSRENMWQKYRDLFTKN